MSIPAIAFEICGRFLAAFEARYPGCLQGRYLVGSIALDDFQPGRSDVDFVAVTREPVGFDDVAPIHADLATTRPVFDGIYVTEDELHARPDRDQGGVAVIEGRPIAGSHAERHPVTWLTLARHAVAYHGPAPSDAWIGADLAAAQAYSRSNLVEYWQPWIEARRSLAFRAGAHALTLDAVAWSVLGISRLHAMIAQGAILSKTAAGLYALEAFPEHRSIIECALAARRGRPSVFPGGPLRRRQAMLKFLDHITADALALRT